MKLKNLIYKLGAQPKQSAQFFIIGLIIFWLSAALMWFGSEVWHRLFYVGLFFIVPAFIAAIYGYIGLFSNRYAQMFNALDKYTKSHKEREK